MDFANYEFIGDSTAAQTEVYYAISQKKVHLLLHRDVKKDEEVLVPIGSKINQDCLIYSGFVPAAENPINFFELRLGFSKNTPSWKIFLAQRMRMLGAKEMGTTFPVHPSIFHNHPLNDIGFWRFAKLFVANSESDISRRSTVIKARDFLLQRFQLFLDSFKNLPSIEPEGTLTVKSVWRLKNAEKNILEDLVKYFQQPIEEIIKLNGQVLNDEPTSINTQV